MNVTWVKAVSVSIVVAAAVYLIIGLWAGRHDVAAAVALIGWGTLPILLGLSLTNYGLRFLRWHYYLRKLGGSIPWSHDLRVYLGGFALTTTPGKAGELARTLWLVPYRIPAGRSVAVFFAERIQDFIAILLLSCVGISLYPSGRWLLLVGLVLIAAALCVLFVPATTRVLAHYGALGSGRLARVLTHLTEVLTHIRGCLTPAPLLTGLVVGMLAWSAECWSFAILMQTLGFPLSLATAFSIYAFSMFTGAISFLPGGLGGSEATMIVLLRLSGVPLGVAVSGTVLIRLATLWFAVLLGVLALVIRVRVPSPAAVDASLAALPQAVE